MRKKRKDFAVSFKEKCYVINKYEKNREINFFTGHSGSGKSTVIDAMQLVLYANTDGRGFFNKAAADDSDRSLIEYLRGMVNIGENNEFSYLRNQNFLQLGKRR